jgi:hypothetical protein
MDFGLLSQREHNRIQKHQSAALNCALRRDRRMTINWCESARCSNTRSKRDRRAEARLARTAVTDEIMVDEKLPPNC